MDTFDDDQRDYTRAVAFPDDVHLRPIARVLSPFTQRHGTPRQPGMSGPKERGSVVGRVVLLDHIDAAMLRDLSGFSHVWLLSWMHLNGPRMRPLVRPPRGGPKRGVLATRAPHRPNPIALSAVRLLSVQGREITVDDLDLIDGTPVLDIKPYIVDYDAHPRAARGWLDDV